MDDVKEEGIEHEPPAQQEPQFEEPQHQEPDTALTEAFKIIREQQAQMQDQQKRYQEQIAQLLRNGATITDHVGEDDSIHVQQNVQQPFADAIMPGSGAPDHEPYVPLAELGKEIGKPDK